MRSWVRSWVVKTFWIVTSVGAGGLFLANAYSGRMYGRVRRCSPEWSHAYRTWKRSFEESPEVSGTQIHADAYEIDLPAALDSSPLIQLLSSSEGLLEPLSETPAERAVSQLIGDALVLSTAMYLEILLSAAVSPSAGECPWSWWSLLRTRLRRQYSNARALNTMHTHGKDSGDAELLGPWTFTAAPTDSREKTLFFADTRLGSFEGMAVSLHSDAAVAADLAPRWRLKFMHCIKPPLPLEVGDSGVVMAVHDAYCRLIVAQTAIEFLRLLNGLSKAGK